MKKLGALTLGLFLIFLNILAVAASLDRPSNDPAPNCRVDESAGIILARGGGGGAGGGVPGSGPQDGSGPGPGDGSCAA